MSSVHMLLPLIRVLPPPQLSTVVYFFCSLHSKAQHILCTHILFNREAACVHAPTWKILIEDFFLYIFLTVNFFLTFCARTIFMFVITGQKVFKQYFLFSAFPLFRTSIPDSWNETNFLAHSVEFDKTFSSFLFFSTVRLLMFVSSPIAYTYTHSQWVSHLCCALPFSPGARAKGTCQNIFPMVFKFFLFPLFGPRVWKVFHLSKSPSILSIFALNSGTISALSLSLFIVVLFSLITCLLMLMMLTLLKDEGSDIHITLERRGNWIRKELF